MDIFIAIEKVDDILMVKDSVTRTIQENISKLHNTKENKKQSFWVYAILYWNGISIEFKNLIVIKYLIYNKWNIYR